MALAKFPGNEIKQAGPPWFAAGQMLRGGPTPHVPSQAFALLYLWWCVGRDLWGGQNITETLQLTLWQSAELLHVHGVRVDDKSGLLG